MSETKDASLRQLGEVLNALDRCFLVGGSPGVKLAAGLAFELLTGRGLGGRPLPARSRSRVSFAVSVTILAPSMDKVLLNRSRRGSLLPRINLQDSAHSVYLEAKRLSRESSGDDAAELALLGRPLAVELWDDDPEHLVVCLNFLAISRTEGGDAPQTSANWTYVDLDQLDLNRMDPRECLAVSEMLSIMGFANPYDLSEDEKTPLDIHPAA